MHVSIDINYDMAEELKKTFSSTDVKSAVETLINRYMDRHSQEREIADKVIYGLQDVKDGKTRDINKLLNEI